jgi:hypothetical protein
MNELYELKEKLCRELKKYSNEEVTTNSLEVIDKLSHAIKNIDKIIEKYEEEEGASYGYGSYEGSYRGNRSGRGSYNNGNSYARGRGRNARRDSMGRYSSTNGGSYENGYSRNGDIASELRELMMDAPDEQTRMEYQKVINKLEQMM